MEEEKIDYDYLKGFNESYLITEHLPELSEKLSKVEGDTPRLRGMRDGRQQYLSEQVKNRLPSWLKTDKATKTSPSPGKGKSRDFEPPSKD